MPKRASKCKKCSLKHVPGTDCPEAAAPTPEESTVEALMKRINSLESQMASRDDSDSSSDEVSAAGRRRRRIRGEEPRAVPWSHSWVTRNPASRAATKDNLSVQEYVSGYLIALQRDVPSEQRQPFVQFLIEVMQDAQVYPWDQVRHFSNELFMEMEQRRCTWENVREMTRLRFLHLHSVVAVPRASKNQRREPTEAQVAESKEVDALRAEGKKPCPQFQAGTCSSTGHHDSVLHYCSFCFFARHSRQESHGEATCIAKSKSKK